MKLKAILKSVDLFGHKINLNFDGHGSSYPTVFGGFASVLVRAIIMFYVLVLTIKMFNLEADTLESVVSK
jgi:hypothetical protein